MAQRKATLFYLRNLLRSVADHPAASPEPGRPQSQGVLFGHPGRVNGMFGLAGSLCKITRN